MHGLRRRCGGLLIRRVKSTASENAVAVKSEDESPVKVEKKAANASTVYRPPYYRKAHQHHTPKHMLQDEFPNAGDASGAGVRLFDYYKTAEMVNSMPTIKEKIDLVSPYERPWTRAERTWRRDWHPALMSTRKAWGVPPTPQHFDVLNFYQFITKTRIDNGSLDEFYHGLRPPTEHLQTSFKSTLEAMNFGEGYNFEDEDTDKLLASLLDEAMNGIAHNVSRLGDYRVAYNVESEAFWVKSGFSFLYKEEEIGTRQEVLKLHNNSKYIGDDRRKLGELAFVHRDKLAAQVRTRDALAPIHSLDSDDAKIPVFEISNDLEDEIYSPKVYNLWPDQEPLWQCPGYHADSNESHSYGILGIKSLRPLRRRVAHWMGWETDDRLIDEVPEAAQMMMDGARSQAVVSMFATLCAQAHTHGFTQYTDVTRPFTTQLILSDGLNFYFAIGQLNTLAINIECDGFVNPRTNYIRIEGPFRLFDSFDENGYSYVKESMNPVTNKVEMKNEEGLNESVLERVTQMLMKQ